MSDVPDWLAADVSRETMSRLEEFNNLLKKWSTKINLVSRTDLTDVWDRHIWDSAQLWQHFPETDICWDIGSGGGFPGLVCAVLEKQHHKPRKINLVESDQRKSAFLNAVKRALDLNVSVHNTRVQDADRFNAELITARALADISTLLRLSSPHLAQGGRLLLSKGKTWKNEVTEAKKCWSFKIIAHESRTEKGAAVLDLTDIVPR